MDTKSAGLALLVVAAVLAVIGLALIAGLLNWFGKLPGDIRMESERSRVFIPVTSMIILSVILTVLINIFRR